MHTKMGFVNCISLGWFCGTAASMNKYGLRGFSGPFDWFNSDLPSVLEQINEGFQDFMSKDNLELVAGAPRTFVDKKYGFMCFHDIKVDFEREYPDIKCRYDRRSARFLEAVKNPSCLLRAVRNEKEVEYINSNSAYISEVVTKYNIDNEVIFLLPDNITEDINEFCFIRLRREYGFDSYSLRTMFDSSKEMVNLSRILLPPESILRNQEFDRTDNSSVAAEVYKMISNNDIRVLEAVVKKLEVEQADGIYIWGAGHHGMAMYKYLTSKGVKINAVVDINAMSLAKPGIPLVTPSEIPKNAKIFIAIASVKYCDEAMEMISDKCCKTVTYKDLRKELGLC